MAFVTLRKIAYQFRKMMAGGDPNPDFPITEAYAVLHARQCLNFLLKPEYFDNVNNDQRSGGLELMIASYEVDVLGEDNHQYLDLPDFYIRLPFNKGLKGIAPIEEPTNEFIPRHTPEVTFNLPCADAEGQMTYYTEGKKVYFDKEVDLAKVLVKLIIAAPDSIGVDDSLPIYPEQQTSLLLLMKSMFKEEPVQDKIIDNNKDISVRTPR